MKQFSTPTVITRSAKSKPDTPEQALQFARKFYDERTEDLDFQKYESGHSLNQIEILDEHSDQLAAWLRDDLRVRLAAPKLLNAAESVLARWCEGDLAEAVRALDNAVQAAKGGAA
jgi:hypothetical protein